MSKDSKAIAPEIAAVTKRSALWMDPLLGLLAGFVGGLLCKAALGSWTTRYLVFASLFGLVFGFFFRKELRVRGPVSSGVLVLYFSCGSRFPQVSAICFPVLATSKACSEMRRNTFRSWWLTLSALECRWDLF